MGFVLILVSILFAIGGLLSLSNATLGVGSIAFACFIGIMARLAQAAAQHTDVMAKLEAIGMPKLGQTPNTPTNPYDKRWTRELTATEIRCQKCGTIATRGPAVCPACAESYA